MAVRNFVPVMSKLSA